MKNLKNLAYCLLWLVAVLGLNACGGTTDVVSPTSNNSAITMTAKINGESLTSKEVVASNLKRISGGSTSNDKFITASIGIVRLFELPFDGVGSYKITNSDILGNVIFVDKQGNTFTGYSTSGTLTITEFNNKKFKGTFNFSASDIRTGDITNVTDGVFDYNF